MTRGFSLLVTTHNTASFCVRTSPTFQSCRRSRRKMSLSTLKPVTCRIPAVTGANISNSNASQVDIMMNKQAPPSLQAQTSKSVITVSEKERPLLQEGIGCIPRREMIQLAGAASLGFLSLLLPAPAEARPRNATMRQKILEKLEELRQKAGLSKPKDESNDNTPPKDDKDEKLAKPKNGTKENKVDGEEKKPTSTPKPPAAHLNEEPALPALPNILNGGNIVDTILS